ncbi:MAG: methionyl-tRNA formyltransferase, partial [Bacteroidales bacterium]|nr:methionyl-tRNA formyltransferase [Bacteroidales bacterium]
FLLDKDLDTGAILHQEKVAITPEETEGSMHDKLL